MYCPKDVVGHTTNAKGEIEIIGMPKGEFDIAVSADYYDNHETSTVVDCDVYHCEACLPLVSVELPHTINPCPGVPFRIGVSDKGSGLKVEEAHGTITRTDASPPDVIADR